MSKIKIPFNGADYNIDKSILTPAKDKLKTHLSTVINGTGVDIDPITYDGVVKNHVYTMSGGGEIIYVKVSDQVLSADDLIGATFTMKDETSLVVTDDNMISDAYGVIIPDVALSVADVDEMSDAMYTTFAETGTYFMDSFTAYPISLVFQDALIITVDGVDYGVDPAKISTATNSFIAHLGTIAGDGMKVIVGGVEYGVDSTRVASAITALETAFGELT